VKLRVALLLSSAVLLHAAPKLDAVVSGSAHIQESDRLMLIQAGDKTILHWKDFSIDASETVRFIQPSSSSAVLNRVVEANPTYILGALEGNGRVYLINPNGVLIGDGARVDLGAFVASTLDVHDQAFLNSENLLFSGDSRKAVVNRGRISTTQGDVLLIGFEVINEGFIEALDGTAGLLAAKTVLIKPEGLSHIYVKSENEPEDGNVFSAAFKTDHLQDSYVYGDPIDRKASLTGEIKASSQVIMLGELVELEGNAHIDVSSPLGGGDVFLGGGRNGLPIAEYLFVNENVSINANAIENGCGGKVILWADKGTGFLGSISARGGALKGDGGFVEVSANYALHFDGFVDTRPSSENGILGTVLLDPISVTIGGANVNTTFPFPPAPPPPPPALVPDPVNYLFAATPTATISAANLNTLLGFNNVVIDANAQGSAAGGSITVSSAVSSTFGRLTLIATDNINVNSTMTFSGPGGINFSTINGDIVVSSAIALTVASTGTIVVNAARDLTCNANVFHSGTGTADFTVGRNMVISGAAAAVGATVGNTNGTLNVTVAGNLTQTGGATSPRNASIGGQNGGTGAINVKVGGNLSLNGGTATGIGRTSAASIGRAGEGSYAIGAINGDVNVDVAGNCTLTGGGGAARQSAAFIGFAGFGTSGGPISGNINLNVGGNLELLSPSTGGAAMIVGGTQIPVTSTLRINVGRNLYEHCGNPSPTTFVACNIGGSGTNFGWRLNYFINVGENFTMDARNGGRIAMHCFNNFANASTTGTEGIVQIHIGGDFVMVAGSTPSNSNAMIWLHPNMVNEIFVGGNWRAFNGSAGGDTEAGVEPNTFFHSSPNGGDLGMPTWRAGGNIVVAGGNFFRSQTLFTAAKQITIEADYAFASGQLWAPQSAIVNGNNIFTGTPLGSASTSNSTTAPFAPGGDGQGAFTTDLNWYNFDRVSLPTSVSGVSWSVATPLPPAPPVFINPAQKFYRAGTTSSADVVINSADAYADSSAADFAIGTSSSTVRLRSDFGNIFVQAFRDTTIQDFGSLFAGTDILVLSNRDINFSNNSSQAGQDMDFQAGGNINSTNTTLTAGQDISMTANGDINLDTHNSSAGRDVSKTALGNITSVNSTVLSGQDTLMTAGGDINLSFHITTAGRDILKIADGSMFLFNTTQLSASQNIDLVVDNAFPTPPGIGPGIFEIDGTSFLSAQSGYIRIYTAFQFLTQSTAFHISPAAQFISGGTAFFFTAGPIYQNTSQEEWCIYYPNGNNGVPFKIFYKPCIPTTPANVVVSELLFDLNPTNEWLNWPEYYPELWRFRILYNPQYLSENEQYWIQRRRLRMIHQPTIEARFS